MRTTSPIWILLASLAVACTDPADEPAATTEGSTDTADTTDTDPSGSTTGATEVDPDAIAQLALAYADYELMNASPLSSQHGLADTMNVWVPSDYAADYRALADGFSFMPETLLVKEQLDADGEWVNVTVMYKGPAGYATDAGDWWFGLVTPDAQIVNGGQSPLCTGCHSSVSSSDWVFGVE